MARILIIGGTGFIGRHLAGALAAAGHEIDAPAHRKLDLAGMNAAMLRARLEGADVVINCAGLVRDGRGATMDAVHGQGVENLLKSAAAAGVRRLVHISALGASGTGETRYQRSKGAGDEAFRRHPAGQPPECCVLRPSVVIGRGGASTAILSALAALPVTPLIGAGDSAASRPSGSKQASSNTSGAAGSSKQAPSGVGPASPLPALKQEPSGSGDAETPPLPSKKLPPSGGDAGASPLLGEKQPPSGGGQVQPIHVHDFAELVVRLAASNEPLPRFLDVTGPEPMGIDAVVGALGRWLHVRPWFALRMPAALLNLMAGIGGRFTGGPLNPETLHMLRRGNTASAAGVTRILGRPPRALAEALALDPADGTDRQMARLYFLRPVLRICLALMWIATGLVSFGLYPLAKSYELMAQIGVTGLPADVALYGAAALDLMLGVLLLVRWRPVLVGAAQLAAMAAFTVLAAGLPAEYWLHPFAPLVKNLPIAAATLVMMTLED